MVDHLFRHQYGKMVAILSKIFGLSHLELIEDAIQDTFLKAALQWKINKPEHPEAWLTQAAKHRVIDLIRQINARKSRNQHFHDEPVASELDDYFLEHEIRDSQLRMIFVAAHPSFSREEQIVFALKTISGFSLKEIAAALLQKEETIKKRLQRTRAKIKDAEIQLEFPHAHEIESRFAMVLQVIYLIFNEGFHSTKKDVLIDRELCGEAMRLCRLLLIKENFRTGSLYALFALMCYHASRLDAKVEQGEIMDLKTQDRSKWHLPLIVLGNDALRKTEDYPDFSLYHLEAAVAMEHVRAIKFENTNWQNIIALYDQMLEMMPSDAIALSKSIAHLQIDELEQSYLILKSIHPDALGSRAYLWHGAMAEYYEKSGRFQDALHCIQTAVSTCSSELEQKFLIKKRSTIESNLI